MKTIWTGKPFLWRPYRKDNFSFEVSRESSVPRGTLDGSERPIDLLRSPSPRNGVAPKQELPDRKDQCHAADVYTALIFYEQATGEAPQEVIQLDGAVLIETGVPGDYERFPNGYVPILISRTSDGWLVCDTGQTPLPPGTEIDGVQREGDVLCVRTGPTPDDARDGVRKMLKVLGRLN